LRRGKQRVSGNICCITVRPFDDVVWARATAAEGVGYAAPSQVVVDCLSGNGRMPAEGEALLAWMVEHEAFWRAPSLAQPSVGALP
jgi:hypothetical protein